MVLLGLALAAVSAATSQIGFLLRHRGAVAAPDVDVRRPLRSAIGLFRSKWWSIGYAVAAVAYILHVSALGLAPLSLVQAVLAGGLVLLGVIAERFFGFELGRREWAGFGLASVGLAFLALTGETGAGRDTSDYSAPAMIAFECALVGAGAVLILSRRVRRVGTHHGVLLGVAAGLLFTVTHVAVKALLGKDGGPLEMLASPYLLLIVAAAVTAFFASARSLQIGDAVPVIAMTSVAGNASAIPAGIIVFGDPLGNHEFEIVLRSSAFLLVLAAAALIPAPMRAAEKARAAGSRDARPDPMRARPARA
jgi:drug/metabolite transporter (DMT)-like permease